MNNLPTFVMNTNERNVSFELELSMRAFNIFTNLIKSKHYLFNPDLMRLRAAYIKTHGKEPAEEIHVMSPKLLEGVVERVSMKTYRSVVDVEDLELFYISERNVFRLKFLSSVSDEFDYIQIFKKSKGA
ncbi:hypothetical protein IGB31_14305 [Pseudomonas putida]|nr:hypothetical protein IGB31_14305 [Pseudomonas putida]